MKFLIDADSPRSIGKTLQDLGHDITDIRDIEPQAADQKIFDLIKSNALILITRDLDFSNILRYPIPAQSGIIILRLHLCTTAEINQIISDLIFKIRETQLKGSLTIVRKGRYRVLKMPF